MARRRLQAARRIHMQRPRRAAHAPRSAAASAAAAPSTDGLCLEWRHSAEAIDISEADWWPLEDERGEGSYHYPLPGAEEGAERHGAVRTNGGRILRWQAVPPGHYQIQVKLEDAWREHGLGHRSIPFTVELALSHGKPRRFSGTWIPGLSHQIGATPFS